MIVKVEGISKKYAEKLAVDALSFSVDEGEILGLIGPNGAGKSSTVKMLLDFMKPDSGSIELFGGRLDATAKESIGYLPEERGLYKNISVIEVIIYLATLKGIGRQEAHERALNLLEATDMTESKDLKIKELSKGMGQMIQFIVTIIHRPKLVILDEPFSGLDPVKTRTMISMISELKAQGSAVILCTHQMNKVEQLCDRIMMVHHGKDVLNGTLESIKQKFQSNDVIIRTRDTVADFKGREIISTHNHTAIVRLHEREQAETLLRELIEAGVGIERFELVSPTLEEIFIAVAGGSDA